MFQEYPKALYLGGDVEAAYVVVADADQEAVAATDGYIPIGAPVAQAAPSAPARRTRGPNKAK